VPQEPDKRKLLEMIFAQLLRQRALPAPPPFPAQHTAGPDGCLAQGGELTPELVLDAYRQGIFPMSEAADELGWFCPDPRTVIDLDAFHVPRRLARTVRQGRFEVRVDTACDEVMRSCAAREDTWISPEILDVYGALHRQGWVHSVETWLDGALVGGLYGVSLAGAFMAESMFHTARDASKVAVVALVERLRARGLVLLDIQYQTKATSVFKPKRLRRREYLRRLEEALALPVTFADREETSPP
jgi:leucyl/phenylalanyl-tRNA---protein transferase